MTIADVAALPECVYADDSVVLLQGRWEGFTWALQRARESADARGTLVHCLVDPPYSELTHRGSDAAVERSCDGANRAELGYEFWTPEDVHLFVASLNPLVTGWFCAMTDDVLAPSWRAAYQEAGRYDFAPVSIIIHKPRLVGDGPGSCTIRMPVCRPREKRFIGWGSLPGWYRANPAHSFVQGAKSLDLMRALVRDYSRPGDLILDPCAGGATTLLAARLEGRRAIGIEMDPETAQKAATLLKHGRVALRNPDNLCLDL